MGMTPEEVEKLLGGPPLADTGFMNHLFWARADKTLTIITIVDGVVAEKEWLPSTETWLDLLRRWLNH